MNPRRIVNVFSVFLAVGSVVALFLCARTVSAERYLGSGVPGLLLFELRSHLWVALLAALALAALLETLLWAGRITAGRGGCPCEAAERSFAVVFLSGAIAFAAVGWSANRYLLPAKLSPISLLSDAVLLACVAAAGWLWLRKWRAAASRGHGAPARAGEAARRFAAEATRVSRRLMPALLVLVVASHVALAWRRKALPDAPNVVIFVVDSLRYDHVGCNGYARPTTPVIDGVARRGIVFDAAYSHSSWTKPSVTSLLTGRTPIAHRTNGEDTRVPRDEFLLPEILRDRGYATVFLNGGNWYLSKAFGLQQGSDVHRTMRSCHGEEVTRKFLRILPRVAGGRFFAYLHYMDAHLPYPSNPMSLKFADRDEPRCFEPGLFVRESIIERLNGAGMSEADRAFMLKVYDGQIAFVDQQIGIVLEALERAGAADNTIVIVTADHGEEFWDHGWFEHGHSMYEELIRIPLVVSVPGVTPGREQRRVLHSDIVPTLLRLADVEAGRFGLQGSELDVLLSRPGPAGPPRDVFAMDTYRGVQKAALIEGEFKLVVNCRCDTAARTGLTDSDIADVELYNLVDDRGETARLERRDAATADRLTEKLLALARARGRADKIRIDADLDRKLRSLGYTR